MVKRSAWRRILQERVYVQSAEQCANCAQEPCSNVSVLYIKSKEVADVREELEALWSGNKEPRRILSTRELN